MNSRQPRSKDCRKGFKLPVLALRLMPGPVRTNYCWHSWKNATQMTAIIVRLTARAVERMPCRPRALTIQRSGKPSDDFEGTDEEILSNGWIRKWTSKRRNEKALARWLVVGSWEWRLT